MDINKLEVGKIYKKIETLYNRYFLLLEKPEYKIENKKYGIKALIIVFNKKYSNITIFNNENDKLWLDEDTAIFTTDSTDYRFLVKMIFKIKHGWRN